MDRGTRRATPVYNQWGRKELDKTKGLYIYICTLSLYVTSKITKLIGTENRLAIAKGKGVEVGKWVKMVKRFL